MFLVLAGCGASEPGEPVDSAGACDQWEEFVWLPVESEASHCPEASEVDVNRVGRWQGCEGDEVVAILERLADTPSACSFLLGCDWSCSYRARARNCTGEPTGCWII